jgi:hypothetical protein
VKRAQPERAIRNLIWEWFAYQKNCMVWVNASRGAFSTQKGTFMVMRAKGERKGVPDLLGVWQGKPLAIEVKSQTGKLTTEQLEFLSEFRANGGIGFMARSLDDVKRNLQVE